MTGADAVKPLQGVRVCMLMLNDVVRNGRARKEARSLCRLGADVVAVGVGDTVAAELETEPYSVRLVPGMRPSSSRLWPVRVASNLLGGRESEKRLAKAAAETDADVYHCADLITLRAAFLAARTRPVIYDSYELYLEQDIFKWWQRRQLARVERRYAPRAAAVITVNPFIAERLQRKYDLKAVDVLYNSPERCLEGATPVHEPVRVLFQGGFWPDRNLPEVVRAVRPLKGRIVLTLQGWGQDEQAIQDAIAASGLEDTVRLKPPCAVDAVIDDATQHDIGLITYRPDSENNRLSSPNKLFEYMAAGLAIVPSDLPFIRSVVESRGIGLLADPYDPAALVAVIESLAEDPRELGAMKDRAAEACSVYAWPEQELTLQRVYEAVLK